MDVLTVGMLARNEAPVIGATVKSLLRQSIFDPASAAATGIGRIEVIIVPNGCTDDTAGAAQLALAHFERPHVRTSVREQAEGGKSRAWNTLVHELAPADTNFYVMMDADIEIGQPNVVEQLICALRNWPDTDVTTSEPIKLFSNERRFSPQRRFSRSASAQAADPHAIAGSLYCARAKALRRTWLPIATPGEDGFLCAIIKTDGFTRPPLEHAVLRVPETRHYYRPDEGIMGFVRHEARLLAGTAVNIYLFEHLWEVSRAGGGHAGALIKRWNQEDPHWVDRVVAQRTHGRRWRLPGNLLTMRLQPLRKRPLGEALRRAPVAILATLASLAPIVRANRILGRAGAARHW